MNGQQVFRATAVCVDVPLPSAERRALAADFKKLVIDEHVALARLTQVTGEAVGLGLARFTADEQWWIGNPAEGQGDVLHVLGDLLPRGVEWREESISIGDHCREPMSTLDAATDGRLQRREVFILGRRDLRAVWQTAPSDIGSFACAHLECSHDFDGDCAASCNSWRVPLAITFERAEPFDRAAMCDASTANPAER